MPAKSIRRHNPLVSCPNDKIGMRAVDSKLGA